MKILIADDDTLFLTSVAQKLKEKGYDVDTAIDGESAIELLKAKKMDLIISDIMMPKVSGLSFVKALKQLKLDKIPVILISSLNEAKMIVKSLHIEVNDIMVKPLDYNEFLMKVSEIKTIVCCYRNLVILKEV